LAGVGNCAGYVQGGFFVFRHEGGSSWVQTAAVQPPITFNCLQGGWGSTLGLASGRLTIGNSSQTVRTYEIVDGMPVESAPPLTGVVGVGALSSDGMMLAARTPSWTVRLFDWSLSGWVLAREIATPVTNSPQVEFGRMLALHGTRLAVGANNLPNPHPNPTGGVSRDAGVFVYDLTSQDPPLRFQWTDWDFTTNVSAAPPSPWNHGLSGNIMLSDSDVFLTSNHGPRAILRIDLSSGRPVSFSYIPSSAAFGNYVLYQDRIFAGLPETRPAGFPNLSGSVGIFPVIRDDEPPAVTSITPRVGIVDTDPFGFAAGVGHWLHGRHLGSRSDLGDRRRPWWHPFVCFGKRDPHWEPDELIALSGVRIRSPGDVSAQGASRRLMAPSRDPGTGSIWKPRAPR
jgi:hypothetical protein